MTRKDYEKIAAVIKDRMDSVNVDPDYFFCERNMVIELAEKLALMLEIDNPLFNRRRFLDTCGILD